MAGIILGACMLTTAIIGGSRRSLLRVMWDWAEPVPQTRRLDYQEARRLGVVIVFLGWVEIGAGLIALGLSSLGHETIATAVVMPMLILAAAGLAYLLWATMADRSNVKR